MHEMRYWPNYTKPNEKSYTLKHVQMLETTLEFCKSYRTAVQAGGSIGYWPQRMGEVFERVITFEPEPTMNWCLTRNLAHQTNVEVRSEALGSEQKKCGIQLSGFGSHFITPGDSIDMIRLDDLHPFDVDLIQLDVEGYEEEVLRGAEKTIKKYRPIIQVEILKPDASQDLFDFLSCRHYKQVHKFLRDYVFASE